MSRNNWLDCIQKQAFEDKLNGVISRDRFMSLLEDFQTEQLEIAEKIKYLECELKKAIEKLTFPEKFIQLASEYGKIRCLNRELLFKLIDKIEVFHAEKVDDRRIITIKIYYRYVGVIETKDVVGE